MAKNLRTKIKPDDTMIIHDVNEQTTKQFVDEMRSVGPVTAAQDVREVAENSVSTYFYHFLCSLPCLSTYVTTATT